VNFDLGPDQRDAAAGARDFYRGSASPAAARDALEGGAVAPGRKALADIGYLGIAVPESAGGAGGSLLDLAVVAEQGGAVLAGPSLATAARAAVLLAGAPDLAAQLADGSAAFAVVDGPLTGSSPSIDAVGATLFLGLDDDGALVVGEGDVTPGRPLDATRGLASVRLTSRRVLAEDAGQLWTRARQVATVVLAAEDLGAADAAAPEELPLAASAAKAHAAEVLERAAETCVQVHGGIGFTWEYDAHLYWRRAKVDRLLLGDAAEHLDAVARLAVAGALG
jgi:alkylation response protein AidB-like acyl-CoA dehydrogenase